MLAMLPHAAHILRAERVLIMWDEPDEPWANLAGYPQPSRPERLNSDDLEASVAEELSSVDFLSQRQGHRDLVLYRHSGELRNWEGAAIGAAVRGRLGEGNVLSACLPGRTFDLDDVRAQIRQQARAKRPGQDMAEVEHADPCEW